ncbi:Crp/Fnr family transcriptional regulator [Mucilaginibacter sp. UYCu711]|uniref:Crp/Fnr family transcriptional regulator n=1 Tax=Mucilaginibacter sp. UYCu711 TaxID=3156339 RepID=UPI003D24CFF7
MKTRDIILIWLLKVLEAYKPQKAAFYDFEERIIERKYCSKDIILCKQGDVTRKVYFLSSGTALTYTFTDQGEKQLLNIFQSNEIVVGESFTLQGPSEYFLMACANAYLLSVTHSEIKDIYRKFPEVEELSMMVISAKKSKEIKRIQMLNEFGIKLVRDFYKIYTELLEPGKVLRDADSASYLLISEGTLRSLRNRLLHDGSLKIHH